jgi:hypothetical protein
MREGQVLHAFVATFFFRHTHQWSYNRSSQILDENFTRLHAIGLQQRLQRNHDLRIIAALLRGRRRLAFWAIGYFHHLDSHRASILHPILIDQQLKI